MRKDHVFCGGVRRSPVVNDEMRRLKQCGQGVLTGDGVRTTREDVVGNVLFMTWCDEVAGWTKREKGEDLRMLQSTED